MDNVGEHVKEELTTCSKAAHSVPEHARCVKKLLKASRESGEAIVKGESPLPLFLSHLGVT